MSRKIVHIILALLGFGLLILIAQEALRDHPYRWNPTYLSYDKEPYGSELLYRQLDNIFPDKEIEKLDEDLFLSYDSIVFDWQDKEYEEYQEIEEGFETYTDSMYEVLEDSFSESILDSAEQMQKFYEDYYTKYSNENINYVDYDIPHLDEFDTANILMVKSNLYLSNFDLKAMLTHVYQGNNVLLAASNFSDLDKYIHYKLEMVNWQADSASQRTLKIIGSDSSCEITNRTFMMLPYGTIFDSLPAKSEILMTNNLDEPTMVKIPHGRGNFYLCTTPILFTNYYMLKPHRKIIEKILTFLPVEDTYWGNDYANYVDPRRETQSLLQFIMSEPALKWAYYVLLFTVVTFMLFELKRKQNAIPVIQPPKNSTLEFVSTISQMYLAKKNHKLISDKKIAYFLEYLRSTYQVKTTKFDEQFYAYMTEKTGYSEEKLRQMFYAIRQYNYKDNISKEELHKLNNYIYKFKSGKL